MSLFCLFPPISFPVSLCFFAAVSRWKEKTNSECPKEKKTLTLPVIRKWISEIPPSVMTATKMNDVKERIDNIDRLSVRTRSAVVDGISQRLSILLRHAAANPSLCEGTSTPLGNQGPSVGDAGVPFPDPSLVEPCD